MKKKDIMLISIIAVFIIFFWGINKLNTKKDVNIVKIYVNNKLYKQVNLNKDSTIKINENGEINTIHIHNNGVEMTDANCPDEICVKTGFIKDSSRDIVCIPHKVQIKIDKKSNEVDEVSK